MEKKELIDINFNPVECKAMEAFLKGDPAEGTVIQKEFIEYVKSRSKPERTTVPVRQTMICTVTVSSVYRYTAVTETIFLSACRRCSIKNLFRFRSFLSTR